LIDTTGKLAFDAATEKKKGGYTPPFFLMEVLNAKRHLYKKEAAPTVVQLRIGQ
jgi:hypothetical protein